MKSLRISLVAAFVIVPFMTFAGPFDDEQVGEIEAVQETLKAESVTETGMTVATPTELLPSRALPMADLQPFSGLKVTVNSSGKEQTFSGLDAINKMKKEKSSIGEKLRSFFGKFGEAEWFKRLSERKNGSSIFFGEKNTTVSLGGGGFLVFTKDGLKRAAIYRYSKLTDDERKILEASSQEIDTPEGKKTVSGKDLFAYLATHDPDSLQGFLNVCAKLRSPSYTFLVDGKPRTALSMVMNISYFSQDRFRAETEPIMKSIIEASKNFSKVSGHGDHYPDSWKQNDTIKGGGQVCFNPDGTRLEADVDMFNIARGGKNPFKRIAGIFGHIAEVLMPGKTDPYKIHNILSDRESAPSAVILDLKKDPEVLEKLTGVE